MLRTVSNDYVNRKSKYKHYILSCCTNCRNVQVYKVTDDVIESQQWGSIEECDECGSPCGVCIITKYQKPPGFARKCKECNFRFTCATTRVDEIPAILVGISKFEYAGFQMCIKSGTGEECIGKSCPLYEKCKV